MSTSLDWAELIKDRKGVITKDNQSCGNIIGEDEENIIIEDGAVRQHFYRIPKTTVGVYNGAELTLNISYDELKTYEDKNEDRGGILESIKETIKDKTESVKEKTIDRIDDDDERRKEYDRKGFHQDTQISTGTDNQYRENQEKELNRNIDSGAKSDANITKVQSTFTCEKCNTTFTSRQELKEHFSSQH